MAKAQAQAQLTEADYLAAVTSARTDLSAAQETVVQKQIKLEKAQQDLEDYRLTQRLAGAWTVGDKIKLTNRVTNHLQKDGAPTDKRPKVTGFKLRDGAVFLVLDVTDADGKAETLPLVMCEKAGA